MKFSENWLRSHVPTSATRDELTATLTAIGLEVEEVTALGEGLDKVVVARIVDCARHPQADRLQVCQVDAGLGEHLQIVCGAPNARAGLVAPLAMVGANVGGIAIKAARLRGVDSNGMLCSARELGVDADASGLLELPSDAPLGTPIADFLGLPDASIEIKLTPNRADCFSVRGIAFDVAAAFGSQVVPFDATPIAARHERALEVRLDAGADAPRYCGRIIEGVDATAQTPAWLAERLRRSGVRPVSLLVDITQYVMLELGQPMHAFDRDLLTGPIGVRKGRAGESLQLLDGRTAALDDGFLVITDADRPVALAGIMGGQDTKVTDATGNVFLESAYFAPSAIIGRGRRLGLHTDASHRYERGVDPALAPQAIELATRLIVELAGGLPGPVVHAALHEHLRAPAPIALRRARVSRVLGMQIADADVVRILRALGMELTETAEGWSVVAPSRRFDIAIEEDLIEELARIHGYDRIPATVPGGATRIAAGTETRLDAATVRRQLAARELLETINFAFVDAQLLDSWGLSEGAVPLANPLSGELGVMRTSLLPGLVATLQRNAARQAGRIRLFELGNVFAAAGGQARTVEADVGVAAEVQRMADGIGALDILVNNAGILQDKPFLETTEADWDRVLTVDLKGVFLVCRALVPTLLQRTGDPGRASIVNIASDLGLLGRGRYAAYCAAKAGVIGLTKSLAREFAPQLRVNAVAPGPVATAMVSAEHMSTEWLEKELDIPQHRLADPAEVADTVLFLASDLSRFYTGQVLGPNGGSVMP